MVPRLHGRMWGNFSRFSSSALKDLPLTPMKAANVPTDVLLNRIRAEYREMPGLVLNREQARRLWHLDDKICGELLDALVETRFLQRRIDGRYIRTGGERDQSAISLRLLRR